MKLNKFAFSLVVFLVVFTTSVFAFAQVAPVPVPLPATLSAAAIVASVVAFLCGVANQYTQSGKIFNQWTLPAALGPYIVTVGSFLGGVSAYISANSPFVLNSTQIFNACMQGLTVLLVGASPSLVAHIHGAAVNNKRPAPIQTVKAADVTVITKKPDVPPPADPPAVVS